MDAEFSGPAWMFGTRSYQALSDGSFLAIYNDPKARLHVSSHPATPAEVVLLQPQSDLGRVRIAT